VKGLARCALRERCLSKASIVRWKSQEKAKRGYPHTLTRGIISQALS